MSTSKPKEPSAEKHSFSGLFMTTFIAIGVAIGAAFSNIPVCMCVGGVIGAFIDGLGYRAAKKRISEADKS